MTALIHKKCTHATIALNDTQIAQYLRDLAGWKIAQGKLERTFLFSNFYETISFVNAISWLIHREDHHPELIVTYKQCTLRFDTHSINDGRGGISENDFIAAAKIDTLFAG